MEKMEISVHCGNLSEHGLVGDRPENPVPDASLEKKIDPCRIGPRYLKFGTLQHNIVSIDDTCVVWLGNFMMVLIRYQ